MGRRLFYVGGDDCHSENQGKRTIKDKLKEKIKSAPKELVRRGLDDGTKHLWGQLREAAQLGQANDCGGDRIEDTAARGANQTRCGVEHLLKKKKSARGRKRDGEPHTDDPSAPPGNPEGMLSLPLWLGANTLVGRVSTPRPRLCAGCRVREHLMPGLCRRADSRFSKRPVPRERLPSVLPAKPIRRRSVPSERPSRPPNERRELPSRQSRPPRSLPRLP